MSFKSFRSVIATSMPSLLMANGLFSLFYFLVSIFFTNLYNILSLGKTHVVEANMSVFSPTNILITGLAGLSVAYITMVGVVVTVKIIVYDFYRDDFIPLLNITRESVKKVNTIITWRNFPLLFLVYLFPQPGLGPEKIFTFSLPPYILEEIAKNSLYSTMLLIAYAVVTILVILSSFLLPSMVIKGQGFWKSFVDSVGTLIQNGFKHIFITIVRAVAWMLIVMVPIIVTLYISKFILVTLMPDFISIIITNIFEWLIDFTEATLPNVLMLASFTITYLRSKKYSADDIKAQNKFIGLPTYDAPYYRKSISILKKKITWVILLVTAISINYSFPIFGKVEQDSWRDVVVIAHRGDQNGEKKILNENSIDSYSNASKLGADLIELDTYQDSDGQFVISHDPNLKRITGVKVNVADLTTDQFKKIRFLNGGEMSTLEEVLIWAKQSNVNLLIEPKIHGKEKNMEQSLVDLIKKYDLQDKVSFHSLNLDTLNNLKNIDPNIKVGYTIFGGLGDFSTINTDFYSIQETALTRKTVERIHSLQKKVYVWTINDPGKVKTFVDMDVDGIITDNVSAVKKEINNLKQYYTNSPRTYINLLGYRLDITGL